MKSENEIMVRCKQPIKIDKPLFVDFYNVGEGNILQTVLLSHFSLSSYFLIALQSDATVVPY